MFRTKTKRSAATTTRKRKELDADSDNDTAAAPIVTHAAAVSADVRTGELPARRRRRADDDSADENDMARDDTREAQQPGAAAAVATATNGASSTDAVESSERNNNDDNDEEEEEAMLARMRSRNAKRGKQTNSMTFRSRTATHSTSSNGTQATTSAAQRSAVGGSMTIDDDIAQTATADSSSRRNGARPRKREGKIRPNLLVSDVRDSIDSNDNDSSAQPSSSSSGAYSVEMLAALRSEQNVLLRPAPSSKNERTATTTSDPAPLQGVMAAVTIDELDGATIVMDESIASDAAAAAAVDVVMDDDDADDFIPLSAQPMASRKKRNRVTFGVQADAPRLTKTTPVSDRNDDDNGAIASDDDDERERRAWEDELMRRGGFHPTADRAAAAAAKIDKPKRALYPTHKTVLTASLTDVLAKLERSRDAARFDTERAERERMRFTAEAQHLRDSVAAQQAALDVATHESEYFQVVETFVKGLSYCVRAKARDLVALEAAALASRAARSRTSYNADVTRVQAVVDALVANGLISAVSADAAGLAIYDVAADAKLPTLGDSNADAAVAAALRHGFVDRQDDEAIEPTASIDVFADAIDDMTSLARVCSRFNDWRRAFPHVYASCYCDVALAQLIAPYVRAELVEWDPLSVALASAAASSESWSLERFDWFRVLQAFSSDADMTSTTNSSSSDLAVAQVRDVVLVKARDAVSSYFDPFASLHTRSICVLLEQISRREGFTTVCASALSDFVEHVARAFVAAAKRVPLLALGDDNASDSTSTDSPTIGDFAVYELARLNALLDNVVTFFVALPRDAASDASQRAGFRSLMQLLHVLLAYVRYCKRVHRIRLVPHAVATVAQLTASPFLQQLLASSAQELELKHVLELLAPFCSSAAVATASVS